VCGGSVVILSDVLYVSNVCRNLILVSILIKKGYEIRMKSSVVTIFKGKVKLIVIGARIDDMNLIDKNITKAKL
jgi:hypothetical protein